MDTSALIVISYVAIGAGLLWLSARLARRIRSLWLRAAIYAAVFAVWFSPGGVVGEGGAMIVPEWMAFLDGTLRYFAHSRTESGNPWPLHYWKQDIYFAMMSFAVVWAVGFVIFLSIAGLRRRLRKDEPAA